MEIIEDKYEINFHTITIGPESNASSKPLQSNQIESGALVFAFVFHYLRRTNLDESSPFFCTFSSLFLFVVVGLSQLVIA